MVVNETAVENETEEPCDPTTEESVDFSIACQVELEISSDGSSLPATEPEFASEFAIEDKFETFEQLEKKMKVYEQINSVQFWKHDSRTVETAQRRMDRRLKDKVLRNSI